MRIVALNIRQGGAQRASRILEWALALAPDILVFSEWRNNGPGDVLKRGAEGHGFATQSFARTPAGSNGMMIAAKEFFKSERITPGGSDKGELLLARWSSGFTMVAGYFPQLQAKAAFLKPV